MRRRNEPGPFDRNGPDTDSDPIDALAWLRHEVANALTAADGWLEVARREPDRAEEAVERARIVLRLAREWLEPPTPSSPEKDTVDAARLFEEAATTLGPWASGLGVRIESSVPGDSLPVAAPAWQLRSIFWNLLRNAIEASSPGATVRGQAARAGDRVVVRVEDAGRGMDAEALRRATLRGFSTKGAGRGVGLSLVRALVERLGGRIRFDSSPGLGTQVRVDLPAARAHPPPTPPGRHDAVEREAPEGATASLDGCHVLLVEDDPDLLELSRWLLGRHGARVTAATTVAAARNLAGPFDVLVVDERLPDGSGSTLAGQLLTRWPEAALILTSGAPDELSGPPGAMLLRKPFEPSALLVAVQQAFRSQRKG